MQMCYFVGCFVGLLGCWILVSCFFCSFFLFPFSVILFVSSYFCNGRKIHEASFLSPRSAYSLPSKPFYDFYEDRTGFTVGEAVGVLGRHFIFVHPSFFSIHFQIISLNSMLLKRLIHIR